jgi:hypothetical protein
LVNFTPQLLYPWVKNLQYALIGGLVGCRAILDILEKRKIVCFYQESNPRSSSL